MNMVDAIISREAAIRNGKYGRSIHAATEPGFCESWKKGVVMGIDVQAHSISLPHKMAMLLSEDARSMACKQKHSGELKTAGADSSHNLSDLKRVAHNGDSGFGIRISS